MTALAWTIPVALFLGGLGLAAFLWSLMKGQFDDLEGAGWRALEDKPLPRPSDVAQVDAADVAKSTGGRA